MKRALLSLALILTAALLPAAENYYYEDYSISVDLDEDGTMHYREDILVHYLSPMHGIIRDIQYMFDDADPFDPVIAEVSNVSVYGGSEASLPKGDGYYSVRFGSADRLVDGLQRYSFSYDYSIGADRYDDYDEFYQNMLSAANGFPIKHLSFSIRLPKPCDLKDSIWVTYGDYGSDSRLPYELSQDGLTVSGEAYDIRPYQAVTVRIQFPEGYYIGQAHRTDLTVPAKVCMTLIAIVLLAFALFSYYRHGADEKPVPYVRFSAPDGMNPIDADYLRNSTLNGARDTAGMIFYWADKGYLEIADNGKKDFVLTALKPLENASEEEAALYSMMFGKDFPSERSVKDFARMNLPTSFSSKIPAFLKKKYSGDRALFTSDSKHYRVIILTLTAFLGGLNAVAESMRYIGLLFLMTAVLTIFGFLVFSLLADRHSKRTAKGKRGHGILIAAVLIDVLFSFLYMQLDLVFSPGVISVINSLVFSISFPLLLFIGYATEKRTGFYNKSLEAILGYEDFIRTVEEDRLRIMADEDPSLFYHVLGYAVVFGLADQWAAKFRGLYVNAPSWYVSSDPVFDYLVFSHFADKWSNAYKSSMYTSSAGSNGHKGGSSFTSFGSSGFAGGGFSGGGSRGW